MKIFFQDGDVFGVDEHGNEAFRECLADFDPDEKTLLYEFSAPAKGAKNKYNVDYDALRFAIADAGGFTIDEMRDFVGFKRITKKRNLQFFENGIICLATAPNGKVYQLKEQPRESVFAEPEFE